MDCILSELKEVEDTSLISYVSETIQKQEIRSLYESFCEQELEQEVSEQDEHDTFQDTNYDEVDDTFMRPNTIRGQKEKEKEKEKQQQKEKAFNPNIENNPDIEDQSQIQETRDVKEIVAFWDNNGFGYSNLNAKQQLLSWLNDSSFLHPKDMILKAMTIACANNKRKLNYVIGILKNWENESLLTLGEIDSFYENQNPKHKHKHKQSTESFPSGRAIPSGFELDLTAGEEW